MASSPTSDSWSPYDLLDEPTRGRAPRTSADGSDDDDDVSALPDKVTSRLRTRKALRDICKKYSIPDEFAPVLAGDLSSCSPPPPGSVCVYVDALDAGMRLPLHPFYGTVLSHFELAPAQLAPNGWRSLAGFVVLSHFAGVAPSLAVFRHFFSLCPFPPNRLYTIRGKDAAGGLLFGLKGAKMRKAWKEEFFFLSSAAPWPCPVEWGEPYRSATFDPSLTVPEKAVAEHLLRARGSSPIDLTTYLHDGNMAAAKIIIPPPPSPQTHQGMGKPVNVTTAARAPAGKVALKKEPDYKIPPCAPSLGKKRKPAEDDGGSASDTSFPLKPPTGNADGKQRGEVRQPRDGRWIAARRLLQGAVTPLRRRELAACRPSDVVTSTYVSLLQTANEVAFSLGYALELEEKLRAREREADALRSELRRAKAELPQAKAELHTAKVELAQTKADALGAREEADALRAELRRAKAELAQTTNAEALRAELRRANAELAQTKAAASRAVAERELRGYERGLGDMKRTALRRYPLLDPSCLVVRLQGTPLSAGGSGLLA